MGLLVLCSAHLVGDDGGLPVEIARRYPAVEEKRAEGRNAWKAWQHLRPGQKWIPQWRKRRNNMRGRREPGRGEHHGSKERQEFQQGGVVHRMETSCESTDKGPLDQAEQFQ